MNSNSEMSVLSLPSSSVTETTSSPESIPSSWYSPMATTPSTPVVTIAPTLLLPEATPLIRLLFTGDINPGRCPAQLALHYQDFTLPYQYVSQELRQADITIGSLDGSISDLGSPAPCEVGLLNFIGPARTVEGLLFAGFDVITVATNHIKNCGSLGGTCENRTFFDTLQYLSNAGIQPTGAGENLSQARMPVVLERQGIRFAFLGISAEGEYLWADEVNPGTAPLAATTITNVIADISAARAIADVVIVLVHWGVEYETSPDDIQLKWAEQMINAGATLVIGNHPHVIQPVEQFNSGVVAYALGNFVFDQDPLLTRQGVVFEAMFRGKELEGWRLHPIHIYNLFQPKWSSTTEGDEILQRVHDAEMLLPQR